MNSTPELLQQESHPTPFNLLEELENKSPNLDKIRECSSTLESLLISDPPSLTVYKSLGHCNQILSNPDKAHECYQKCLFLQGTEDAELWYGIGLLYYNLSQYTYSEPSFLKVLSIDPGFPMRYSLYLKLGLIFKRHALYSDSITYLEKCLEGPDAFAALCQLGFCQAQQNSPDSALRSFTSAYALQKTPHSALSLAWHLRSTDCAGALALVSEGLSLCQKDSFEELDLLYARSRLLHHQKQHQEALKSYYLLFNKNSGDAGVWNSFGILCWEMGQNFQAFKAFIKASEINSGNALVWGNIGTLYWKAGQGKEAKQAFKKALQISPGLDYQSEGAKEFVHLEWDVSELPYASRSPIVKMKLEVKEFEVAKESGGGSRDRPPAEQSMINNYAVMVGYFNYAWQMALMKQNREKGGNEEDKQAAEILTDLSKILPAKRNRNLEQDR